MEETFDFIEDMSKKLSRPIKDLDDIRLVMAALKDIRENEIRIDMGITPIEVLILPYYIQKLIFGVSVAYLY